MKDNKPYIFAGSIGLILVGMLVYYGFFHTSRDFFTQEWHAHEEKTLALSSELKSLATEIQTVQGDGNCKEDENCHIIGIGSQACGLFANYLIYSDYGVDTEELLKLVKKFNAAHRKITAVSLNTEKCGKKPTHVFCFAGRCAPRPQ